MESDFENKVRKGIEKFEGKSVKITISGVIESKFCMKKLKYEIEESTLIIEDENENYFVIDIDDIESVYSEFTANGYALLILKVRRDLQIEIQTRDDNVISIKEKILKMLVESAVTEELYNKRCGA